MNRVFSIITCVCATLLILLLFTAPFLPRILEAYYKSDFKWRDRGLLNVGTISMDCVRAQRSRTRSRTHTHTLLKCLQSHTIRGEIVLLEFTRIRERGGLERCYVTAIGSFLFKRELRYILHFSLWSESLLSCIHLFIMPKHK